MTQDNPNPYLKNTLYDPNKSDQRIAELRGITVEEMKQQTKEFWNNLDLEPYKKHIERLKNG